VAGDAAEHSRLWDTGCIVFQGTARLTLKGRVAGKRPQSVLWVAVSNTAARIEADAGRQPFVLTTPREDSAGIATLQLADGRRVESREAVALAQIATGLPLTGPELQNLLFTCPVRSGRSAITYRTSPDALDVLVGDNPDDADVVHMSRGSAQGPWNLLAMTSTRPPQVRWRTVFYAPPGTIPKTARIYSVDWKGQPSDGFDVTVEVDQVQVTPLLSEGLFTPGVSTAGALTIEELRAADVRLPLLVH